MPPLFPNNLVSHYITVLGVRSAAVVQNGWCRFVGLLDVTLVSHYAFLCSIAEYLCLWYHKIFLYLVLDYVGTFTPPPIPTNLVLDYTFVFRVQRCSKRMVPIFRTVRWGAGIPILFFYVVSRDTIVFGITLYFVFGV